MYPAGVIPVLVSSLAAEFGVGQRSSHHHHPQHQEGGHLHHQVLAINVSIHHNQICIPLPRLAMGRAHVF
jgi:hypothetical protein